LGISEDSAIETSPGRPPVISGRATLHVGGEEHLLEPGVFARVGAIERRKLTTGDEPARILAMGASPGKFSTRISFLGGQKPPAMASSSS
jgi:hypothetical protein